MDKRGFTLIELLAVVAIISLLTVVAVPSALNFQENMRRKMFCSKVETIERSGKLYGNDVLETIKGDKISDNLCGKIQVSKSSCQFITINALLSKGYIKKEANALVKDKKVYDELYDPRNWRSMKKAYARYVYQNKKDSEFCNKEDADKKAANPSKVFGYYYEQDHTGPGHGRVLIW